MHRQGTRQIHFGIVVVAAIVLLSARKLWTSRPCKTSDRRNRQPSVLQSITNIAFGSDSISWRAMLMLSV